MRPVSKFFTLPGDRQAAKHVERHNTHRIGWLRAAVLGANDGLVSTASLLMGVAAAGASHSSLLATGAAGLVAGAMSMAAGEYVSVYSQADTESADLQRESAELQADPDHEHHELTDIYIHRGLQPELAAAVATQLMAHDALGAHARDELGITSALAARPLQAAWASAASFSVGAALPLAVVATLSVSQLMVWLPATTLLFLAGLGVAAARAGGARVLPSVGRVTFWGALAMGITSGVGWLLGAAV